MGGRTFKGGILAGHYSTYEGLDNSVLQGRYFTGVQIKHLTPSPGPAVQYENNYQCTQNYFIQYCLMKWGLDVEIMDSLRLFLVAYAWTPEKSANTTTVFTIAVWNAKYTQATCKYELPTCQEPPFSKSWIHHCSLYGLASLSWPPFQVHIHHSTK